MGNKLFKNLDDLNSKLENDNLYKFFVRHKKVINIIQGLIVIGLLIGINSYLFKDHSIKEQIAETCGYIDYPYKCICEKSYVDRELITKGMDFSKLNISLQNDTLDN